MVGTADRVESDSSAPLWFAARLEHQVPHRKAVTEPDQVRRDQAHENVVLDSRRACAHRQLVQERSQYEPADLHEYEENGLASDAARASAKRPKFLAVKHDHAAEHKRGHTRGARRQASERYEGRERREIGAGSERPRSRRTNEAGKKRPDATLHTHRLSTAHCPTRHRRGPGCNASRKK